MSVLGGNSDAGPSRGPFSLLASDYRQAMEFFQILLDLLDEPDVSLVDVASEVLALPPERRFTDSASVYLNVVDMPDVEDADDGDLPPVVEAFLADADKQTTLLQLLQLLDTEAAKLEQQCFERLLSDRSQGLEYLLFAVYLQKLRDVFGKLETAVHQEVGPDELERLASELTALHSHFLLIAFGEKTEFDAELLRDILQYDFYDAKRRGADPGTDPETLDIDAVEATIRQEGAIVAYDRVAISVSRGAELAGTSREEFEELLVANDVQPRYGPDSADELRRGPGLSKSE